MGAIGIGAPPCQRMGLVIPLHRTVGRCHHKKPNVQVEMLGFARAGRNRVHVEVESRFDHLQSLDAGLLGGLGQRDLGQVCLAVGMAAGLQPAIKLHMMQDERRLPCGIDDSSRAGQMTVEARSMQCVRMSITKLKNLFLIVQLGLIENLDRLNLLDR